jgi:ribose 5-phosphate isomerase A
MIDDDKRLAAEAAVAEIEDGMRVGLGTGSTAAHAIRAIGRRRRETWPRAVFFATSRATRRLAIACGVPIGNFALVDTLDLTIDGADEIDPGLIVIKGGGGALLREKIVAAASRRMVVIADATKCVQVLGEHPLPVEILPFARSFVERRMIALGGEPCLRTGDGGKAARTDQGNMILDCRFGPIAAPEPLAAEIDAVPGVMGHGLFVNEVAAAYIADRGRVERLERH